jgi:uncharacterized radical SAM protein YgiQ
MTALGWQRCDVIIVTGDAYVDHPSFGMAIIGRVLEAQGFKVGIIAQPDWHSTQDFEVLGAPRLFFGVTGGNMDSMVNRYTSDRRVRSDDAYTPGGLGGKRPDRSVIVYSQRLREAFKQVPIVVGGIEASLRRIAHFDYWSESVRRSVLVDAKADMLVYGNAERQIGEIARRLSDGESIDCITDLRGTAFMRRQLPADWVQIDSTELDAPGALSPPVDPYADESARRQSQPAAPGGTVVKFFRKVPNSQRDHSVIRMPSYEQVASDPVLYAHASRILHLEANPGNARALVQRHGAQSASEVRRRQNPGLPHDQVFGGHSARLLWRLYVLFHHRARRAHHPEPVRRVRAARDRNHSRPCPGFYRRHLGSRRPDGQHVPLGL